MPKSIWLPLALCVSLLAACAPAPTATVTPTATDDPAVIAQAATSEAASRATEQARAVQTDVAATLTAQPTDTATPTDTPTDTPTATKEPTNTRTPTPKPTETDSPTATSTRVPVTAGPTAAPTRAQGTALYGFTSGPAGYLTDIECFRGGVECSTVMGTGDVNFTFYLLSFADAPLTLFEKYGLAVERNGANVPEMFMFVDAGFLEPGALVRFGASRNFTTAGSYVIRSSGCMATSPVPCGWNNLAGTTVNFTIQ